jgi:Ino eighty subunit 1
MASPEPSAAPSEGDTIDDQPEDAKPNPADLDDDQLEVVDVGTDSTPVESRRAPRPKSLSARKSRPKKGAIWIHEQPQDGTEDEGSVVSASHSRTKKSEVTPETDGKTVGTAVGTRRLANGTVGSVYSGSKIRHIKKADGTPLWRKEIQYQFLHTVIADTQPVFTRLSDGKKDCTFADIYVDCMARSSKTSKILKDRLQIDQQAAHNMAMICLLVNVGRMNTTLNFFPEMRAQLRTYHSIPSLQAYKSQQDYKSLQDAPRLKSILKGASEDTDEPRTIAAVRGKEVPRTNPVNLIFVLSQFASKISELHFTDRVDFFDLAMRTTISSASRARAFLWLMWWYLESNFSKEDALRNPYGPGEYKEGEDKNDPEVVPQLVPALVNITEEEGDAENQDPEEEVAFAEKMTQVRKRIMAENANEPPLTMADPGNPDHKALKRVRQSAAFGDDDSLMSDLDSRASPGVGQSPAPEAAGPHGIAMTSVLGGGQADSLEDDWEAVDPHPGRGRYKRVRGKNTPTRSRAAVKQTDSARTLLGTARDAGTPDTADRYRGTPQPLPLGKGNHPVISQFGTQRIRNENDPFATRSDPMSGGPTTKARARTGYQRELEEHRQRRVEWALRRRRKQAQKEARMLREGGRWLLRAARRISELPPTYDSEDESEAGGPGFAGMLGRRWFGDAADAGTDSSAAGLEADDFGEEVESWASIFRRTGRRLQVWGGDRDLAVYHARLHQHSSMADASATDPTQYLQNGARKKRRLDDDLAVPAGIENGRPARGRDLNDEITQDLLAERSDDDMEDEESDENGELDESDMDMD